MAEKGNDPHEVNPEDSNASLYERLGGLYGIATAVDDLVDRLYVNASANNNPHVKAFHDEGGHAGFKFLVTAWSIEETGGPKVYAWRNMRDAHKKLEVSPREFDIVRTEIKTSLYQVGVPEREMDEFMAIIDSYRDMVMDKSDQPSPENPHLAAE